MFVKNRNSLCVLCYNPAAPEEEHRNQSVNSSESKFLVFLFRYLKIKPNSSKISNQFLYCNDCASLANSFCDLYFQLEYIRIELEFKLERLYEKMVCAERVPSLVIAFRAQFENPQNEEDGDDEPSQQIFSEIQDARKNLMKNCQRKLKSSKPRVLLTRISEKEPTQKEKTLKPVDSRDTFEPPIADSQSPLPSPCQDVDDDFASDKEELHGKTHSIFIQRTTKDFPKSPIKTDTKTIKDSQTTKPDSSSSSASSPRKPLRTRFKCPKCFKTLTNQESMNAHLKLHEEKLISEENSNSNLDSNLVSKEEENGGDDDFELDQDHSDVDMEECSESEEELARPPSKTRMNVPPIKLRDPKLPFIQCEICLVKYDCEAAVEKCRVLNHNIKDYVCCHTCREFFSCHYLLVQHRNKVKKCSTKNPEDLKPAAAPQFPTLKLNEMVGNKFCPLEGCFEVFKNEDYLKVHLKTHGNWGCNFCQEEFGKAHELALHELKEHCKKSLREAPAPAPEISKRKMKKLKQNLCCPRCEKKFVLKERLISHILYDHLNIPMVQTVEEVKNKCEICKNPFASKSAKATIQNHIKTHHDVEKMDPSEISRCAICQAPFKLCLQLRIHMSVVHNQKLQLKCPHCEKSEFITRKKLRDHIRRVHKGKSSGLRGKFECEICKEKLESQQCLKEHMKIHVDEDKVKIFKCEKCEKTFSKRINLYAHNKNIHEEPKKTWHCDQCGKMFKMKTKLDQHTSYTHTDPSKWRFVCPEGGCGRRCWSRQKLTEHIRTHTKERPFICDFCGESYRFRQYLRAHLAKVHGESAAKTLPTQGYTKPFDMELKEKDRNEGEESENSMNVDD